MSWEHTIASEFKKRDNPAGTVWFSGKVKSPIRHVDPVSGDVSYEGSLKISCFGGEAVLGSLEVTLLSHLATPYAGQTVALCGNPFSDEAGGQKFLCLGAIS